MTHAGGVSFLGGDDFQLQSVAQLADEIGIQPVYSVDERPRLGQGTAQRIADDVPLEDRRVVARLA